MQPIDRTDLCSAEEMQVEAFADEGRIIWAEDRVTAILICSVGFLGACAYAVGTARGWWS